MRRVHVSWLMSLLLVLAQHGAVLHELGHLGHASAPHGLSLQRGGQLLDNGPCMTCEAFAQVATPAAGKVASPVTAAAALIPTPAPGYAIVAADVPSPRSRGPPQV
jgi:hypothetical protein